MPREIFPSSYVCDCGQQSDHFERTIWELKEMSEKRQQTLIAEDDAHEIIFENGEFVAMWCPLVEKELMAESELVRVLIEALAEQFAALPQVVAVALSGSRVHDMADAKSDIDLYVYTRGEITLDVRQSIVQASGGATRANMGMTFWGASDEWVDAKTGLEVDVIYFEAAWIEAQIRQVTEEHVASMGYTTCFWYTVQNSEILYDSDEWFENLQTICYLSYPETLRDNIIALNHPVLRTVLPAYSEQLALAVQRQDLISINHRLTALFASYFDIIFALNRLPHPGEKRLIATAVNHCSQTPVGMADDIKAVLAAGGVADPALLAHVDRLLDRLDHLLVSEGYDTQRSQPTPIT